MKAMYCIIIGRKGTTWQMKQDQAEPEISQIMRELFLLPDEDDF